MNLIKRMISLILSIVMVLGVCSAAAVESFAAKSSIVSLEIKTLPDKLKFYRGVDWDYGIWDLPDNDADNSWVWKSGGSLISFLHNQGSGIYPERGMIDMTGLEIEIKYSDNTSKILKYKETPIATNVVEANILVSPQREFFVGKNVLEVYVKDDINYYDTYEIEIINSAPPAERKKGDVNNDGKVNSTDAYMLLSHSVGERILTADEQKYADINGDKIFNSTDALMILRIAVGMA